MSDLNIVVVVPCYRERNKIMGTLARIPDSVTRIYCVDDACPDQTGDYIEENCSDKRVLVLRHKSNQGVGGAMVTGYRQAMHDNADIVVKIDGDGQMNPESIMRFVRPIVLGHADYTKGNRFFCCIIWIACPSVVCLAMQPCRS